MNIIVTNYGGNTENKSNFYEKWIYDTEEEKGKKITVGDKNSKYSEKSLEGEKQGTHNVEEISEQEFIDIVLKAILL